MIAWSAAACSRRRIAAGAAAALFLLMAASAAGAQPGDDLLRVLKPWIKRQLLGGEKPAAEPGPAESAGSQTPSAEERPAASVAQPPPDATEAAGEAQPQGEVANAPADDIGAEGAAEDEAGPVGLVPENSTEPADAATGALPPPVGMAEEPLEQAVPPLRFAVLAGRSATATIAAVGPIADDIGATIDRPVELLAMPSYAAMIEAQVERRIDGGFYSASAFAIAGSRCHCLEPIVAPRASDGTLAYHAVIVARADSGMESAFDLAGKIVAVGAADSLGARRMQLAGLMASGIDPATAFGGVLEVDSASEAVRLVRDGIADAAFAWSSLSGNAPSGYSRGTLTQLVASGEIAMPDIAIVWRSSPITHGPFAVLNTLSDEEKDKIGAFFVALEATRPAAYDTLNPFYAGGYAPVDAEDYRGLETLTAQNVDALRLPKAVAEIAAPESAPPADADEAEPPPAN